MRAYEAESGTARQGAPFLHRVCCPYCRMLPLPVHKASYVLPRQSSDNLLVKCGRGSLCIDRRDRRRRSAGLYIGADGARGAFATHPFPANTMSMQRVSTRAVRGARGFHCTPAASASISFNSVISKVTNDADKARLIMHRQRDGSCVRWTRRSLHEVHLQFDSAPSVRRLCYLCALLAWRGMANKRS